MAHLGARLEAVRPGYAEIHLPFRSEVRQQDGYVYGGAIASILDSVAGYAAFSLVPADINILTVEYKLNFVNPGVGDLIIARGQVVKPGRTLTVVQADAYGRSDGAEKLVATSIQTLMALPYPKDRPRG